MTWVKLSDDALHDPRITALGDDVVLGYLRALATSNRYALDGRFPRASAPLADAWVAAGLAEDDGDDLLLVWLIDQQPTADEILGKRKEDARRQARTRRHNRGDHSLCDPDRCRVLLSQRDSRRDSQRDSRRKSRRESEALRPDPSRPVKGGEERSARRSSRSRPKGSAPSRRAQEARRPDDPVPTGKHTEWIVQTLADSEPLAVSRMAELRADALAIDSANRWPLKAEVQAEVQRLRETGWLAKQGVSSNARWTLREAVAR